MSKHDFKKHHGTNLFVQYAVRFPFKKKKQLMYLVMFPFQKEKTS